MGEPPGGCPCFNGPMVVIFGFGAGSPEDQGEVAAAVCPNCHNQVFFHHVRSKKSVRLYFVPVVPYGTNDYLVCPVCSRGLQVNSGQLPQVRSMSRATASFRAGRLPQDRYLAQAGQFWRRLGVNPAGQQLFTPPGPGAAPAPRPPVPAPSPAPSPGPPAAPVPPPPVAADDQDSWLSQLHKLAQLHDQGVLSDDAFEAAKRRLLEREQNLPLPQRPGGELHELLGELVVQGR
jgi:hypothetical protein